MASLLTAQPFQFPFEEGLVVLIDKPLNWTSFDIVNKMKYAMLGYLKRRIAAGSYQLDPGQKLRFKIGHAGTLDPLASGLLIVCLGKQTKQIDSFMGMEKEYTGTITLGTTTPSFDLETPINQTFATDHITPELIHAAATTFIGEQLQVPPVYSAIKKDGKRLYESARAGKEVEIESRKICIHAFDITDIRGKDISFRIRCSKGTYIRSIAHDFGKALQSGAHLSALRRTQIGLYQVSDAISVNTFQEWVANAEAV